MTLPQRDSTAKQPRARSRLNKVGLYQSNTVCGVMILHFIALAGRLPSVACSVGAHRVRLAYITFTPLSCTREPIHQLLQPAANNTSCYNTSRMKGSCRKKCARGHTISCEVTATKRYSCSQPKPTHRCRGSSSMYFHAQTTPQYHVPARCSPKASSMEQR